MSLISLNTLPIFTWPSFAQDQILVVGIGGGSDIISAYALGESLQPRPKEIIYANTKTRPEADWLNISPHIATLPIGQKKEGILKISSGSTTIDRLLPKGARQNPFIFLLEKGETTALTEEIKALGFSMIIAVDTGGDVLARNGKVGRDQRMLSVLEQTGLPLWLCVLAPGSDGQRAKEKLRDDLTSAFNESHFRGAFSLQFLVGAYQLFAPLLPKIKTPNLIRQAFETQEETMLIPRGCHPMIPVEWLRMGLVFHNKRAACPSNKHAA
jgi:hypothetical protein